MAETQAQQGQAVMHGVIEVQQELRLLQSEVGQMLNLRQDMEHTQYREKERE